MLIGVLIFGGIVTGLSSFATEIGGNYNRTDAGFPAFDKSNSINTTVANFMDQVSSGNIFVQAAAFLLMPATIISIMLDSWGYTAAMISEMFSSTIGLPIPAWFVSIIMVGAFAVMIFALWNAITGRRET